MNRLHFRQIRHALLVLALYAPVVISVGWRGAPAFWTGLSYVWFVVILMAVFAGLSWWFASVVFGEDSPAPPPKDGQ